MSGRGGYGGRGGGDRGRGGGARGGGDRGRGGGGRGGRGGFSSGPAPVEVFNGYPVIAPDPAVKKIEDEYMSSKAKPSTSTALAGLSVSQLFPPRPGYGTQGAPITVWANYVEVLPSKKDVILHRYNVRAVPLKKAPEATGKKLQQIIRILIDDTPDLAGCVTDYKSTLLMTKDIGSAQPTVIYRKEGEDAPTADTAATETEAGDGSRQHAYQVLVEHTGTLSVTDLWNYVKSTNPSTAFDRKLEVIQGLNILLGHFAQKRTDIVSVGGNKHFPFLPPSLTVKNLGEGLEALRGFYKSVRMATGRLVMNVNVSHMVFIESTKLDTLMKRSHTWRRNALAMERFLKKVRVETTHLPSRKNKAGVKIPRVKTIFALARPGDGQSSPNPPKVAGFAANSKEVQFYLSADGGKTSATTAKLPTNKYISVFDFFKKMYPTVQIDPTLPVVNVGNAQNPSYLPAEVCQVLPGQSSKRKLSPDQTREMIEFACRKPKENATSIAATAPAILGLTSINPLLVQYGINVGTQMLTVPARVLVPPRLQYKSLDSRPKPIEPRFGSWNMDRIKFHTGGNMGKWTCIILQGQYNDFGPAGARATVMSFAAALKNYGISGEFMKEPPPPSIQMTDNSEGNVAKVSNILKAMATSKVNKPKFVLIILPKADVELYKGIKTIADLKAGISTVCVVAKKFAKERGQDQYFANVALKFNLKSGGINQTLEPVKLGIISEGKTMVVGIDVTHPQPGAMSNAPSVAGIVASIDKQLGQWPADLRIQESRKEMVTDIGGMFASRLELWKKHNRAYPENVIIYRDGVSEGQYQTVIDEELPQLRKACEALYPAPDQKKGLPKISIIIVGKRHHTRFYPTKTEDADRSSNCKNGTVVDRAVTEVRNWDFFLQAHTCLQGTARPAHYYVVLDEIFAKRPIQAPHRNAADALEELTHNMCHLFGRATKAVSICPAAYYADLLCERARCYLGNLYEPPTPSTSATPSEVGSNAGDLQQANVVIHPDLRDTMFYI